MSLIDKQVSGQVPKGGTVAHGVTVAGVARPILVDDDGTLQTGGGSSGGGDASAANQQTIIEEVSEANDATVLLRRIVKLLEPSGNYDTGTRQRVTVDSITAGQPIGTVTAVTTVTTVSSVTNIAALAGWDQRMFADPARTAYNTGIRSALIFS